MSLQIRLSDLATAVATDIKQLRIWMTGSSSGNLSALTTTAKANLIEAINEVNAKPTGGGGDVTEQDLIDLKADILGAGVPTALDTLDELAAALGDDANFAATVTTALGERVTTAAIGDPETDLVAVYAAAKA